MMNLKVHRDSGMREEVLCFQFPQLQDYAFLSHAVFTRKGGISQSPYHSLNTSFSIGDRIESVESNLEIIKKVIRARRLVFLEQVHGKDVLILKKHVEAVSEDPIRADAMITDIPGVALMVKQADCQGVILFDPVKKVISNIHCGWRGNRTNILGHVVGEMRAVFGCHESDLRAAIGPSLGPCCAEFVSHEEIFPDSFKRFRVRESYFDLWEISRWQLMETGLEEGHIEVAGLCTRCRTDYFYSYRAEKVTGRFGTVVMMHE